MTAWKVQVRYWQGRQPACRRLSNRTEVHELAERHATVTKELRRRCARVIDQLDIPDPFDLEKFRRMLEVRRGRPLQLVPIQAMPNSPCGLWIGMTEADYVLYDAGTSPLHQIHIIVHEIGHLLLDHHGAPWITDELARSLLPDLDPALIRRTLARTVYTETEEQEAETIATMLLERASVPVPQQPVERDFDHGMTPEMAATMTRVASVFSHPRHA